MTDHLSWTPLDPFGIELADDLSAALSRAQEAEFVDLFFEHGLVLARGQRLTPERHSEIAALVAPPVDGGDASYISNVRPNDTFGNSAISFHCDNMYSPHPHVGISLHAVDVVDGASSTRFAHTARAARAMPEGLRDRVRDRKVLLITTSNWPGRNYLVDQPVIPGVPWPQRALPVVWEHPVTGAPFVTVNYNNVDSIVGLAHAESEALIQEIFDVVYAADNVFEHAWRNGDVIFWDNFAVQHGRPAVDPSQTRTLQRVTFGGKGFGEMYPELYAFYTHQTSAISSD